MLRKGATFTLPEKCRHDDIMQGSRNKYYPKVWRFLPRHLLPDLAVEREAITLRGKSARRSIVLLIQPKCVTQSLK